ncbi:DUF3820 family protein [Salinispirillum sp. LH 10-3-1]|uniref:DUF3820 family protein n=1 Tax=Salinispirillum sp. LH 10-3-1 TaxID=2952525 RepID=A0AB38YK41_9GAMM
MTDLTPELLTAAANARMPFGKYQGRFLVDTPEEYLLWFSRKGFPPGKLGQQMALVLLLKTEGQEGLLRPLITSRPR